MTLTDYTRLVDQMRTEQCRYFGGDHSQTQLVKCKELEAKVDAVTREHLGKLAKQQQLSLL